MNTRIVRLWRVRSRLVSGLAAVALSVACAAGLAAAPAPPRALPLPPHPVVKRPLPAPGPVAPAPAPVPPKVLSPRLQAIQRLKPANLGRIRPPRTLTFEVQYELSTDGYEDDPNNVKWSCWALGYHQTQTVDVSTVLAGGTPGSENRKGQQSLTLSTDAPWKP